MKKRIPVSLALVVALASFLILTSVLRSGSSGRDRVEVVPVSESSSIVEEQATPVAQANIPPSPPTPLQRVSRLVVPSLGIDAPTVVLGVTSDGTMQAPSTPTDVGWYNFSSKPGGGGNIVLSGHVDYINYGPAVFWKLRNIHMGDVVHLIQADQSVATYKVTTISNYDSDTAPIKEIIGKTPVETVTLITCDGVFNSNTHEYDKRLVVRAVRT